MARALGMVELTIQRGVGSGTITINEIDPSKSIIIASTVSYATAVTNGTTNNIFAHAQILNSTQIKCDTTMAWTVIQFGGAV